MEQVNDPAQFHSAYKRGQLLNWCNGLKKIGKINKNHSSYGQSMYLKGMAGISQTVCLKALC